MWCARLSLLLAALLLCACGGALRAGQPATPPIPSPATLPIAALPTAALSTATRVVPTPNHSWIDAPILDTASATPRAAPQPTAQPAVARAVARIVIDEISLDRQLLPVGLDADAMPIVPKHDPAWFTQSAAPGQGENVVLWGHALRFTDTPDIPAPFGRLNELKPGAQIVLYDSEGTAYPYTVAQQLWVTPDQVRYIMPRGHEQVTLVSCIGDKVLATDGSVINMTHRLITIAEPVASAAGGQNAPAQPAAQQP